MTDPVLNVDLDDFIEWAETKSGGYDYWCRECPLGRYLTSKGHDVLKVGVHVVTTVEGRYAIPEPLCTALYERPYEYDALATRLKAARLKAARA